jgi:hypothetical protein
MCIAAMNAQVELGSMTQMKLEKMHKEDKKAFENFQKSYDEKMEPISNKLCEWAAPQYNSAGEGIDRSLWVAAQALIYASTIALNTHIQNKQYQIARDYQNITNDRHSRFTNMFAPLEMRLLSETSNTSKYSRNYTYARNRATSNTNSAYNIANDSLQKFAKSYALCQDATLYLDMQKAKTTDDAVNFNYRDEENYAYYREDKRWNRRSDILNIGKNNVSTSLGYAATSNELYGGVASAVAQAGSGLSTLVGFMSNRNSTTYPNQFSMMAPLGTGAIVGGSVPQMNT